MNGALAEGGQVEGGGRLPNRTSGHRDASRLSPSVNATNVPGGRNLRGAAARRRPAPPASTP